MSGVQQVIFNQILLVQAELLGCCWVLLRRRTIKDGSFQGLLMLLPEPAAKQQPWQQPPGLWGIPGNSVR